MWSTRLAHPHIARRLDAGVTPDGMPSLVLERVRGWPVGTAADVFSLGVLLCELLTGHRPHGDGATSAPAAARAVLDEPPHAPRAHRGPVKPGAS